jgi:hypothetical protein
MAAIERFGACLPFWQPGRWFKTIQKLLAAFNATLAITRMYKRNIMDGFDHWRMFGEANDPTPRAGTPDGNGAETSAPSKTGADRKKDLQ